MVQIRGGGLQIVALLKRILFAIHARKILNCALRSLRNICPGFIGSLRDDS